MLYSVAETKNIRRRAGGIITVPFGEGEQILSPDLTVSMNMWGLTPGIFPLLEKGFRDFLTEKGNDPTAEFLLPVFIDRMIDEGRVHCRLLPTDEKWFGLTYKEDLDAVKKAIRERIEAGEYPAE